LRGFVLPWHFAHVPSRTGRICESKNASRLSVPAAFAEFAPVAVPAGTVGDVGSGTVAGATLAMAAELLIAEFPGPLGPSCLPNEAKATDVSLRRQYPETHW
jgi:hypothetical protein